MSVLLKIFAYLMAFIAPMPMLGICVFLWIFHKFIGRNRLKTPGTSGGKSFVGSLKGLMIFSAAMAVLHFILTLILVPTL